MSMQARVIAAWLVLAAFIATAIGSLYLGYQWSDARWEKREARWVEVANAERLRQQQALGKVNAEVERLKARPEKVRTVTQEVVKYVQADDSCASLPDSWRVLWNAEPDDREAPGTARVGDEGMRELAAAFR